MKHARTLLIAFLLTPLAALHAAAAPKTIAVRNTGSCGPWPQVKTWMPIEVRCIASLPGFMITPAPSVDDFGGRADIKLAATGSFVWRRSDAVGGL